MLKHNLLDRARDPTGKPTVAVIGGGLAGLAAAVALHEHGCEVELFDGRRRLGGRAGSFRDPRTGQWIDHCQHLALGCCTNLADFCRRIGVADGFRREKELFFFGPDGVRCRFAGCDWLPAPLHLVPALMSLRYLTFRERIETIGTLRRLAHSPNNVHSQPQTIGAWLRRHGQSDHRTIERFWSVVLVSALGETVDRASLAAARKVFLDGFLTSRRAYQLEVPQALLGEIFDRRTAAWLREHGVAVHLGTPARQIEGDSRRATALILSDRSRRTFDFFVVAVSWGRVRALFPETMLAAMPALDGVRNISPAPITAVHLWFDRPITLLPHAVLVGKMSQWVFNHGWKDRFAAVSGPGHYYQVVISASYELIGRNRQSVVAEVRHDLEAIWPHARDARLVHWRVVTQPAAVFSVRPGLERFRPTPQTPIQNLILAGDWTATGWPATMEGAVRSGYLATEAVLKQLGKRDRVLVDDLPRGWLARVLMGNS